MDKAIHVGLSADIPGRFQMALHSANLAVIILRGKRCRCHMTSSDVRLRCFWLIVVCVCVLFDVSITISCPYTTPPLTDDKIPCTITRCVLSEGKQVSRVGTSNDIWQYLWDVITCTCTWYLRLAQHLWIHEADKMSSYKSKANATVSIYFPIFYANICSLSPLVLTGMIVGTPGSFIDRNYIARALDRFYNGRLFVPLQREYDCERMIGIEKHFGIFQYAINTVSFAQNSRDGLFKYNVKWRNDVCLSIFH